MRRWTMFAALLAGCYQPAAEATCSVRCPTGACPSGMTCGGDGLCRTNPGDDCNAVIGDAGMDDGLGTDVCFGHGLIRDYCVTRPAADLMFNGGTLNTSDATACTRILTQGTSSICVLAGRRIIVLGALRVTGTRPLVLFGDLEVLVAAGGSIDVSSKVNENVAGAGGAEGIGCTPIANLAGANDPTLAGGGGGAGGSFLQFGGAGGTGSTSSVSGGLRSPIVTTLDAVRGGCTGGSGGNGAATTAGLGGYGGGAIYLASSTAIRVHGVINASGSGGKAPKITGGGGGGGSGGLIGLDAPLYDLTSAVIFAVGGSGASGGNGSSFGTAGLEPTGPMSAGPTIAPSGAGAGGGGGDFAAGADGTFASNAGGGGGGGSCGYIGIAGGGQLPVASFAPMAVAMN